MTSIEIAASIFGCLIVGAWIGMGLRAVIPETHLDSDTRDLIKLGVGLIGTMSALVLGLLVASTKGSYDTKRSEVAQMAGNVIVLDRVLAHYGPEAAEIRAALRSLIVGMVGSNGANRLGQLTQAAPTGGEAIFEQIQDLVPHTDAQRGLQAQAKSVTNELGQMRWLLYAQGGTSISRPFLVIVVFWLTVLYLSFGLFAPRNPTATITLLISALSVAGAMFLILDLDHPFGGFMQIPDTPLRNALAVLGK
jgi:hypothetical protein